MSMAVRAWTSWLTPVRHRPWTPSTTIAPKLSVSQLIEEEKPPYYRPERFYPAEIGQVLNGRYQIATKVGYGSSSTVWLARDLHRWRWQNERYVALKICSRNLNNDRAEHELSMLRRITSANPGHDGWHFVRRLSDSFNIDGAEGAHACLVFEALREPLCLYRRRFIGGVIPPDVLKILLRMLLHALDYLHTECEIIHADLKPDNIMVKIEDPAIFARDAQDEHENPLPQKHLDGRIVYLSRNNYGKLSAPAGVIQLVDFDNSTLGTVPRSGCIQADIYRAPEVIFDAGYSYSADIWSLGVMLWDLLEGKTLFDGIDTSKPDDYDEHLHLAQINALLGPIPHKLLSGQRAPAFYEPDGSFRTPSLVPDQFSFETVVGSMDGTEKDMFIQFVKRMVRWCPTERSTAKELLRDPWLYSDDS